MVGAHRQRRHRRRRPCAGPGNLRRRAHRRRRLHPGRRRAGELHRALGWQRMVHARQCDRARRRMLRAVRACAGGVRRRALRRRRVRTGRRRNGRPDRTLGRQRLVGSVRTRGNRHRRRRVWIGQRHDRSAGRIRCGRCRADSGKARRSRQLLDHRRRAEHRRGLVRSARLPHQSGSARLRHRTGRRDCGSGEPDPDQLRFGRGHGERGVRSGRAICAGRRQLRRRGSLHAARRCELHARVHLCADRRRRRFDDRDDHQQRVDEPRHGHPDRQRRGCADDRCPAGPSRRDPAHRRDDGTDARHRQHRGGSARLVGRAKPRDGAQPDQRRYDHERQLVRVRAAEFRPAALPDLGQLVLPRVPSVRARHRRRIRGELGHVRHRETHRRHRPHGQAAPPRWRVVGREPDRDRLDHAGLHRADPAVGDRAGHWQRAGRRDPRGRARRALATGGTRPVRSRQQQPGPERARVHQQLRPVRHQRHHRSRQRAERQPEHAPAAVRHRLAGGLHIAGLGRGRSGQRFGRAG